ncbi:hypothetical protein COCNU_11G012350 [Cocos nucifera]|uniref:Uncharacterized protein n=1 Tax=Cocos nucifera TaxID=13894 RepID=A0A8K0IQR5_COCNU|nr:hypothetical protein COCNU_11G012350 [Cocos nucifera]
MVAEERAEEVGKSALNLGLINIKELSKRGKKVRGLLPFILFLSLQENEQSEEKARVAKRSPPSKGWQASTPELKKEATRALFSKAKASGSLGTGEGAAASVMAAVAEEEETAMGYCWWWWWWWKATQTQDDEVFFLF